HAGDEQQQAARDEEQDAVDEGQPQPDAHPHADPAGQGPQPVDDARPALRGGRGRRGGAGEQVVRRDDLTGRGLDGAAHSRYPTPGTVSITAGSPSFLRSVIIVTRTTLVNGSMCSSQACSRSCSELTTAPSARSSTSRTANSLRVSSTGLPSRSTSRRPGSSWMPERSRTGGSGAEARRPSARTRAI